MKEDIRKFKFRKVTEVAESSSDNGTQLLKAEAVSEEPLSEQGESEASEM
jgi:hypothetical protein